MTFLTIVLRDLWRRPVRTALTLVGIAIGIGAVVSLVGMSSGYEKSIGNQLEVLGTDIIVSDMEGGVMPKMFEETLTDQITALPGVADATPVMMRMISVEDAPMMMVSGRKWGSFTWDKVSIEEGRMPTGPEEPAVVLGISAADILRKKVGDTLQLETEELKVVGIFDGHSIVENGAVVLSLQMFQKVSGYEGKTNFVNVRVTPGSSEEEIDAVCRAIESIFEGRAVKAGKVVGTSQGYRIVRAMSWSTSLLAIVVGVLGVMNTMLMTVFERTHEIGILLALGWKRLRIVSLVLCESAIMGFIGGLVGIGLGAITMTLLEKTKTVQGLLEPDFGWDLVVKAIVIAVAVGVISGLYPAWRSSRLSPSVALQS